MKYYTVKFKGETLNDVFNGSEFESCLRKSKSAAINWANVMLDSSDLDSFINSYDILELDIKVVKKVKVK